MEITLSRLLEGKATIIKGREYLATKEYVQPFIDKMSKYTNKFIVHVQEPDQLLINNENNDTTYNRVWIQAIMPDKCNVNGMVEVYNLVYGLDLRNPIYKVYRNYLHGNNPCVFNSQWIIIGELKPNEKIPDYSIESLMELTTDVDLISKKMQNTFLDDDNRHQLLGELIEKSMLYEHVHIGGKVKLSTSMVIKAFENVYMNSTSNTYKKESEECSVWNYYTAFTELVKDASTKDIINNFEKTILCGQLFQNLINNEGN